MGILFSSDTQEAIGKGGECVWHVVLGSSISWASFHLKLVI